MLSWEEEEKEPEDEGRGLQVRVGRLAASPSILERNTWGERCCPVT